MSVNMGKTFHVAHAVFLLCLTELETVSQPVRACNIGCAFSGPSVTAIYCEQPDTRIATKAAMEHVKRATYQGVIGCFNLGGDDISILNFDTRTALLPLPTSWGLIKTTDGRGHACHTTLQTTRGHIDAYTSVTHYGLHNVHILQMVSLYQN